MRFVLSFLSALCVLSTQAQTIRINQLPSTNRVAGSNLVPVSVGGGPNDVKAVRLDVLLNSTNVGSAPSDVTWTNECYVSTNANTNVLIVTAAGNLSANGTYTQSTAGVYIKPATTNGIVFDGFDWTLTNNAGVTLYSMQSDTPSGGGWLVSSGTSPAPGSVFDALTNCYSVPFTGGQPTDSTTAFVDPLRNERPRFLPNLWRQIVLGKPIRIGCLGDSVGYFTLTEIYDALTGFYGFNGAGLGAGNTFGFFLNATATNVTRLTNWFCVYQELGTGGSVTFSNSLGNPWTFSSRLGCEFLNQTNGGTFQLQLATNGGAFTTVLTISTATASGTPIGNVTNHAMIPGWYAARVLQSAGGIVSVLGCDLWETNSMGVRLTFLNQAGTTIQEMAAVPPAVAVPILRHLGLDLLLYEGTSDPANTAEAAFRALDANVISALRETDFIWLGTTPIDPVHNFDFTAYNAAMEKVANETGREYFDQSPIAGGSFAAMQARGTAADGLHRSNTLSKACASRLMMSIGLLNSVKDGLGALMTRTNFFRGPLITAGPTGFIEIRDQNSPVGPSQPFAGRIRTISGNAFQFGFRSADGTFEGYGVEMNGGRGPFFIPTTMGGQMGDPGVPFKYHGTGSVDYGVMSFSNRVQFFSTCAIASGSGTPEGAVTAPVGSIFLRSDGGAGTSIYVKQSGAGNTGWVGK